MPNKNKRNAFLLCIMLIAFNSCDKQKDKPLKEVVVEHTIDTVYYHRFTEGECLWNIKKDISPEYYHLIGCNLPVLKKVIDTAYVSHPILPGDQVIIYNYDSVVYWTWMDKDGNLLDDGYNWLDRKDYFSKLKWEIKDGYVFSCAIYTIPKLNE